MTRVIISLLFILYFIILVLISVCLLVSLQFLRLSLSCLHVKAFCHCRVLMFDSCQVEPFILPCR